MFQRLSHGGERRQVARCGQREHDVEESSPAGGPAGDHRAVAGRERDGRDVADAIGELLKLGAIHRHLLPPSGDLVPDGDAGAGLAGQEEPGFAEPDQFAVLRPTQRAEQHEVVDGLEQIGLTVSVFSEDDHPVVRKLDIQCCEVAEVPGRQGRQSHCGYCTTRSSTRPEGPRGVEIG